MELGLNTLEHLSKSEEFNKLFSLEVVAVFEKVQTALTATKDVEDFYKQNKQDLEVLIKLVQSDEFKTFQKEVEKMVPPEKANMIRKLVKLGRDDPWKMISLKDSIVSGWTDFLTPYTLISTLLLIVCAVLVYMELPSTIPNGEVIASEIIAAIGPNLGNQLEPSAIKGVLSTLEERYAVSITKGDSTSIIGLISFFIASGMFWPTFKTAVLLLPLLAVNIPKICECFKRCCLPQDNRRNILAITNSSQP